MAQTLHIETRKVHTITVDLTKDIKRMDLTTSDDVEIVLVSEDQNKRPRAIKLPYGQVASLLGTF